MDYTISAFAEKLLQEKGISGLSQEVMDQLRDDLVDRAENIINAEILARMPEEALGEFEQILKKGNDEEIHVFCHKQIDNMDELVANSLIKLQNIYLANTIS